MVSKDGLQYELAIDELGLGYRESGFTRTPLRRDRSSCRPTCAWFPAVLEELQRRLAEFDHLRQDSQPRGRSAGSIFKNAREYPAWWLDRPGGAERTSHRRR